MVHYYYGKQVNKINFVLFFLNTNFTIYQASFGITSDSIQSCSIDDAVIF